MGARRFTTAQQPRLVYSGGFENVLTILKRVSVFSCACTLVGVPLLALGSSNPRMNGVQKWTVAFVVVVFAFGTTAALNVICKPYVVRMYLNGASELSVETLNLVGKLKTTRLDLNHVAPSSKPWATIQSTENPRQRYFLEEARDGYQDQQFYDTLWAKLPQSQPTKRGSSKDDLF